MTTLGLIAAALTAVPSGPAAADACDTYNFVSQADDFASISDGDDDCSFISVRHRYELYPGGPTYWTDTESGNGTYYRSDYARELLFGDFASS